MEKKNKEAVLKAIRKLKLHVTPADVASNTGLPIHTTISELNQIASETGGNLEVSSEGNIAYKFNPAFESAYLLTGIKKFIQQISSACFNASFYLLRISFGIMLILSLAIIVLFIMAFTIAVTVYSKGNDRDSDGGSILNINFSFFDYLILRDLLWWGTQLSYPRQRRASLKKKGDGNFLLDCFSFLFGDGNPNGDLEERKWQMIAQSIRQNNGVATINQLSPFLGANPKNEDAILPVLVRFDGCPEVTETGNIIYAFPDMQNTAAKEQALDFTPEKNSSFLLEHFWKFSNSSASSLILVSILAMFNLMGSWWLYSSLHASQISLSLSHYPLFSILATVLYVYGTLFVVLPICRLLVIQRINTRISKRNEERKDYAELLEHPDEKLSIKLKESENYKTNQKIITDDHIVYTTEKDSLEQEFDDKIKNAGPN